VRVGIIGCGHVARAHLDALTRLEGVEVAGLYDVEESRAAELAGAFGVGRTFEDPAHLLEQVEVAHVLTPPQSHKAMTVQALEAGCHVLVEKPMALNEEEAGEMVTAAARRNRTLGVCHNFLFDPAVLRARELFHAGRFGEIVSAEVFWTSLGGRDVRYAARPWLRDLPGGFFHESMPHPVYLLQAFIGELQPVSAASTTIPGLAPPADELRILFAGEQGLGSASLSCCSMPQQIVLRVYGTETSVEVDVSRHVLTELRGRDAGLWRRAGADIGRGARLAGRTLAATVSGLGKPLHRPHATLIERFYEALRADEPPPVTAEEGRSVVAVLDRLWARLEIT
jgi:predicted dehydrogenase